MRSLLTHPPGRVHYLWATSTRDVYGFNGVWSCNCSVHSLRASAEPFREAMETVYRDDIKDIKCLDETVQNLADASLYLALDGEALLKPPGLSKTDSTATRICLALYVFV